LGKIYNPSSKDTSTKNAHIGPFGFGYSTVDHKEGLRVLTGSRLIEFIRNGLIPKQCEEILREIATNLDEMTVKLLVRLSKPLFNKTPSSVAYRADIPAAYLSEYHFGMLDIAHYFNQKSTAFPPPSNGTSIEEVNCVPHYDPGLLSLSFLSTNEGLQLKDPITNQWISGPDNSVENQRDIGVIWLGEAAVKASDGVLKAAVHRVLYPRVPGSRLTAWYEMCTVDQATTPKDRYAEVTVPNVEGEKSFKGKLHEILRNIERTRGVPMSKSIRIEDSLKWPLEEGEKMMDRYHL